jgi:hypothetical protein
MSDYLALSLVVRERIIPELLTDIDKLKKSIEQAEHLAHSILDNKQYYYRIVYCRKCYEVELENNMHICCKCKNKYCETCVKTQNLFYTQCEICSKIYCSLCDPLVLEDGQDEDISGWTCSLCSS